jgi:NTP pyrophosphatase (non-canonical NTP hydrolase)
VTGIQARVVEWHVARFPACQPWEIALKSMAELGEVAEAMQVESRRGDVVEEAADVTVTLMALLGRFYGADLLDAVERKLTILTTPGAHRHSIGGRQ